MKLLVCFLCVLGAWVVSLQAAAPNVLLIVSEDNGPELGCYGDGDEELCDQTSDPNEWHNLASKPDFISIKADLAKSLPKTDAPARGAKKKGKGAAVK